VSASNGTAARGYAELRNVETRTKKLHFRIWTR